jgi:Ca-activated chloride channel family protein
VVEIARRIPVIIILTLLIGSVVVLDLSRRYLSGDFASDEIELEILYSSEKAGWLESIVDEFEEIWLEEHNQKVRLVMVPIGTAKGTIQIAQGASQPAIWSPASSFWLPLLNTLIENGNSDPIVNDVSPSAVFSPTVIATWEFYQEENNISSLDDIHSLSVNDPEFTFAHTDPFSSNSGFTAVIMQVAAASGISAEELVLGDLENEETKQWMRELQSSVIHYGSSTGFLAKFMVSEGPQSIKATFVYENLVVEKNKELDFLIAQGEIPEDQKLVAVYPEEGVVYNDHPFAILNRPWVDTTIQVIANGFIDFLFEPEIQERAVEYGFRPQTNVSATVLADQFRSENGVREDLDDLKIFKTSDMDGKVVQRIPDLWSATRSRSLDEPQSEGLTTRDFILPALLGIGFLAMVLQPLYSRVRRYYR